MGIRLLKYRVLAFVIATVYALLAGVLYVSYMQSSIYATWSSSLAMNILIAVCLGAVSYTHLPQPKIAVRMINPS